MVLNVPCLDYISQFIANLKKTSLKNYEIKKVTLLRTRDEYYASKGKDVISIVSLAYIRVHKLCTETSYFETFPIL